MSEPAAGPASLAKVIVRKARTFTQILLPNWLRHRRRIMPLFVGHYPGIKPEFIPTADPVYRAQRKALSRGRAFPYDLAVFRHVELETDYLPYLADPGKTSLDIGANVGFYSAVLSSLSARVFTCEANPHLQPCLIINLQRYSNVHLLPFAVFSSVGEVVFNIPDIAGGDAVTVSAQGGILNDLATKTGIVTVPAKIPTIAVDTLALQNVGFMKVDVEGSEYDVLAGATGTITRCRPNIVVENEFRHNAECARVFEFLAAHDYQGYFIDRSTLVLKSFAEFTLEGNQIALLDARYNVTDMSRYVFNFMFVPRESDRLKPFLGTSRRAA